MSDTAEYLRSSSDAWYEEDGKFYNDQGEYSMGQCTDSGTVDGIDGKVDLNMDFGAETTNKKPEAVQNLKASSKIGAVNLSWSEVKRADGYLVYGIRGGGKYGYIGMTSKTSFSDTKVLTSDYNFYWVFPYHTDGNGNKVAGGTAHYVYGRAGL